MASSVRPAGVAGTWYPARAEELRSAVEGYLAHVPAHPLPGRLVGLIVPHAGYVYSGQTAAYAFAQLKGRKVGRVILLGPSHYTAFRGFAIPAEESWRTPLGEVPIERELARRLMAHPLAARPEQVAAEEHSLECQLPFLQDVLGKFGLLPLLIGGGSSRADLARIAEAIAPLIDEHTVLVASSDFAHVGPRFGYTPFRDHREERIRELDQAAMERIEALDAPGFELHAEVTGHTVCGRDPISILLRALPPGCRAERLAYETSGHLTGDWGHSVSYGAIAFTAGEDRLATATPAPAGPEGRLGPAEQKALLGLARATLRSHLRADSSLSRYLASFHPGPALTAVRGVFVTLLRDRPDEIRRHGRLRGCIGDILGSEPLWRGVAENAVNAASRDPRFPAMQAGEEDEVAIEISVLEPPRPVGGPEAVVPGTHGVLLEKRGRRAVFLPQVASEQGWGREELLTALCEKAGLGGDCWREGAVLKVFTAQVFGEKEPAH